MTAGNRRGFKIFSFNTTIRNARRNLEFLSVFLPYDGKIIRGILKHQFYFDLVRHGVYKSLNVSRDVREKWKRNEPLTEEETNKIMADNPQATTDEGRTMTWLRALKDQGLLIFEPIAGEASDVHKIVISKIGKQILERRIDPTILYTKLMIGVHAKNPCRTSMWNESRPFLNTLFVINLVNKKWQELGNDPKGILLHEFSCFVLSMKDCDYEKCANDIINYRRQFNTDINIDFLLNHLKQNNILPLSIKSILGDYPDEVFRKFEMTGLFYKHGYGNKMYISFSKYNMEKINTLLNHYENYRFEEFNSQEEYYNYLYNVFIPWEGNELTRRRIINYKAKILGIALSNNYVLEETEAMLDRIFMSNKLATIVKETSLKDILNELLILTKVVRKKSKYSDIAEPLRLEFLMAMAFGKRYGVSHVISNILYDENGIPLHCATGNKADILYVDSSCEYTLETTMISSRDQQLNSETTTVIRHMEEEQRNNNIKIRTIMIAPRVHFDTLDYFKYQADTKKISILALTINKMAETIYKCESIDALNVTVDSMVSEMIEHFNDFLEDINYSYPLSELHEEVTYVSENDNLMVANPTINPDNHLWN